MAALLSRSPPAHCFMLFALLLASTGAVINPTIDFVLNEAANAFEVLDLDPATGLPGPAQVTRAWHTVSREVHPDKHCQDVWRPLRAMRRTRHSCVSMRQRRCFRTLTDA